MKTILIALFLSTGILIHAQLPDFYVFMVKGEATVSKPGAVPMKLKQQSFIFKEQLITLQKDAELTIADKERHFFVLRSAGTYKVRDLGKQTTIQMPGITQKYLKLVWDELFNPHHGSKDDLKNVWGGVYGGVSRGEDCHNLIYPLNNLRTSGDSLNFRWRQTSPTRNYKLVIFDSERNELVNMSVKDTQQLLVLTNAIPTGRGNYYWLITGENGGCEDEMPLHFEWMTAENEQKFISSLLTGQQPGDIPSKLQAIDDLEKNALIPAAEKYFANLVNEHPGDEPLLKSYIGFLLKYGYDQRANTLWEQLVDKK